jgi:hypothetical protein
MPKDREGAGMTEQHSPEDLIRAVLVKHHVSCPDFFYDRQCDKYNALVKDLTLVVQTALERGKMIEKLKKGYCAHSEGDDGFYDMHDLGDKINELVEFSNHVFEAMKLINRNLIILEKMIKDEK